MRAIEHVVILGAGWVGRQVAARMVMYGVNVQLVDRQRSVCLEAMQWIQQAQAEHAGNISNAGQTTSHLDGGPTQIAGTIESYESLSSLADSRTRVDLILESVPEQISLKKRVLREASRLFAPPTIIASNSSYFVPSVLCPFVDQPQRFAHLHFHVPVLADSVVDIVGCEATLPEVVDRLRALTQRIAQEPLLLRHEHPGYVFNWLLQSVLKSALELVALDVADPQDIDKSWTAVTGMPLGPFGIMDRIGLDVIEQVLSNSRWAEPPAVDIERLLSLLRQHTDRGQFGLKSQRGFYDYTPKSPE